MKVNGDEIITSFTDEETEAGEVEELVEDYTTS